MLLIVFQPKSHFVPSSKGGQNTSAPTASSAKPAPGSADQALSYAEYIVQSKNCVADPPQRAAPSKVPRSEDAGVGILGHMESGSSSLATERSNTVVVRGKGNEGGCEEVKEIEEARVTGTEQKDRTCQRSDANLGPKPVGSGSSIIVSPRQVSIGMCTVCFCWLISSIISPTSNHVTCLERKSYSKVCEKCPMGVWRCCTRLRPGPDDVCSLP